MNKRLLLAEKIFTVISLVHYTGGPLAVILSGGVSEGDQAVGTPNYALIQLLFLLNYAISFFLLFIRWKKVIKILSKDRYIILLLGISVISFLWSDVPRLTLVRNVAILGTSAFGIYIATRYTLKEQLQLLAWTFGIIILLSFLFILGLPKYGIMGGKHAGAWRGIFVHKNVLGRMMIVSGVIFLLTYLNETKHKFLLRGGFVLSIILLLQAKSSSSLISFVILLAALLLIKTIRLPYLLMIPTLLFLAVAGQFSYLSIVDNTEYLLNSIGKDATLTGRTDLWPAVLDKIGERPWLGYGFSGFWGDWNSESAYVWRVTKWRPPNAHNGLLDTWLDLGLLGLSTYLIGYFVYAFKTLFWVRINKTWDSFWPILYMIYFWLCNQTESSLLRQNEIYWVLYVTVIISMIAAQDGLKKSQKTV
jgi:exopolysaccharide production protein ExoQ